MAATSAKNKAVKPKTLNHLFEQAFEGKEVVGFNPTFYDPPPNKRQFYVGDDGLTRLLC
jgi:hypothetical protein